MNVIIFRHNTGDGGNDEVTITLENEGIPNICGARCTDRCSGRSNVLVIGVDNKPLCSAVGIDGTVLKRPFKNPTAYVNPICRMSVEAE